MKMTKKRRLSGILAFSLALSVTATGCEKIGEDTDIPSLGEVSLTTAEMTDAEVTTTVSESETEPVSETTTVPEETSETTAVSETEDMGEATIVTTVPHSETNEDVETSETKETEEEKQWTETAKSATMYVTENCYSREKAIIGSTPISQHYIGDSVEVSAITDTGYYKLAEGGFIHSDYLSDSKPAETTVTVAETEPEPDNNGGGSGNGGSGFSGGISTGNYNVSSSSRYAYKQLSSGEQALYDDIIYAVKNFQPSIEIPSSMTSDDVYKVFTLVYNCEPQLFWLDSGIRIGNSYATISYIETDRNEIANMQAEIDSAAAAVVSKARGYSGTVSQLKVLYDYLVLNNEFAGDSAMESGYAATVYNGLTGRGGVQCAGYAKSMQYLCDLMGIESTIVLGITSAGVSHAWNVVYCENGYYNLDTTWGDPLNDFDSRYIQYEFFLVPDAWIHNISHFNISTATRGNGTKVKLYNPPACTKEACNYFAAYNKLYDSKDNAEAAFKAAMDEAIANGTNVAEIRVTTKELYDTLMSDSYFKTFQKYAKDKSGSVSKLLRRGANTKGVYVVHYDIVYN